VGTLASRQFVPSDAADLAAAAALSSGPGAMLGHATAVWWLGLTSRRPPLIHVSTPRRCASLPGIEVHGRRELERIWHRQLPVAPLPTLLLDYAASHGPDDVRYALARAEYEGWLHHATLLEHLGRGRPGSATLREALRRHEPELAHSRSEASAVSCTCANATRSRSRASTSASRDSSSTQSGSTPG
jgi:hypothetical protein